MESPILGLAIWREYREELSDRRARASSRYRPKSSNVSRPLSRQVQHENSPNRLSDAGSGPPPSRCPDAVPSLTFFPLDRRFRERAQLRRRAHGLATPSRNGRQPFAPLPRFRRAGLFLGTAEFEAARRPERDAVTSLVPFVALLSGAQSWTAKTPASPTGAACPIIYELPMFSLSLSKRDDLDFCSLS